MPGQRLNIADTNLDDTHPDTTSAAPDTATTAESETADSETADADTVPGDTTPAPDDTGTPAAEDTDRDTDIAAHQKSGGSSCGCAQVGGFPRGSGLGRLLISL